MAILHITPKSVSIIDNSQIAQPFLGLQFQVFQVLFSKWKTAEGPWSMHG
jgi:hypothetical protein